MESSNIRLVPELPAEIINAVSEKRLAVFIGAGVSRLVGCWGWDELGRNLVKRCHEQDIINYKEQESLIDNRDSRKTITICHELLKEKGFENVFFDIMKSALKDNVDVETPNIYDDIYRLRGLFITTNADRHFHGKFNQQNIVYRPEHFNPDNIDRCNLYQIHGCIEDTESMVFTVRQYFSRYLDPKFKMFLKKIFDEYTILFLGYGLAEFELLEYLFLRSGWETGRVLKHFMLMPLFTGEERILGFEQTYYAQMGIKVLAYRKDERGYKQLEHVVRQWNRELNQVSGYLYGSFEDIGGLIERYDKSSESKLFQIIRNDKPLEDYAFKKLAECEDPLSWLMPLRSMGYFAGEKNPPPQEVKGQPGFYTIPFWNVLPYLEYVATKNREKPLPEITDVLAEVVDSIISYRDKNGERVDNYRTDWFATKIIFMLPYNIWNEKHIDFIGTAIQTTFGGLLIQNEIGKSVLPALIDNKAVALILKLLEVILGYKKTTGKTGEKIKPVMDEHWLRDALEKFKKNIAELCGPEAGEIGIKIIKKELKEEEGKFLYIWIPTIEDSSRNQFPDKYECQLVFFVRDMFANSRPEKIRDMVEGLLRKEHSIFKRLAVHTINRYYEEFNDLFWNWQGNPLDEHSCKHELYELLKDNCLSFSKEQINKVLGWIESKDYGKYDEERADRALAYYKKEWLSTLLETNNPDVLSKYAEYDKKEPTKLDHPGLLTWSESWVGDISPIQPDELLKKSNEEIAEYLKTWKEEDRWHGPSQDGLRDCLKQCVSKNPKKFTENMGPFLEVQRIHQQSILRGFCEVRNAAEISWKDVLEFVTKIIESDEFWNEKYEKEGYNYRDWIISSIAELIENRANYEGNIFGDELLPQVGKILLTLAEKTQAERPQMKRLIDSVLNSPKGKVFSAMIHYSFCYARSNKDKEVKWPEDIKKDFTRRLDRGIETSLDYSVTLGKFLGNILYLDEKWVSENIEKIFPKENETHWKAAFEGYLSYSQRIDKKTYQLLRENGHYTKALQTEFSEDYVAEKLVQHICIGFLEDWEKLDDPESLICLVLNKGSTKHLWEIIHFLRSVEGEETHKKVKERIKPLWKTMFDLLEKHQGEPDYQSVISNFYLWLDVVDEIDDEIKEWLKLTAKYVNVGFHASELVERLSKHVDKTPQNVAEIYIEMLNAGAYPDYDQKDIIKVVECLYQRSYKEQADRICNMYGEVGYYFLGEIYKKHQASNG